MINPFLIMPFGKHKGKYLIEVPDEYIWWLYGQEIRDFEVAQAVEELVQLRFPTKFPVRYITAAPKGAEAGAGISPSVVASVYRKLAKKYHPDHGGSTAAMQIVNEFKALLDIEVSIK